MVHTADPTSTAEFIFEAIKEACGFPIPIQHASGTDAGDACGAPLYLVPDGAPVLAIGTHSHLPFSLVAYLSEIRDVIVAVTGPAGICRSVSVRIWEGLDAKRDFRDVEFERNDDRALARVAMGQWNGGRVSGYAVLNLAWIGTNGRSAAAESAV